MADKRPRPGSKGEPTSKVDTTGQRMATQAAQLRATGSVEASGTANWPVGMMGYQGGKEEVQKAQAIPFHAPDDARVLNKLFGLDVEDI